jgi:hypothetical protein
MRENVVGVDNIRCMALPNEVFSQVLGKKFAQRRNTVVGYGDLRDICRRFDTQQGYAGGFIVSQQVSVITGYLDDKTLLAKFALFDQVVDQKAGFAQNRFRERREVDVLAKQLIGRDGFRKLNQGAVATECQIKRVGLLGLQ